MCNYEHPIAANVLSYQQTRIRGQVRRKYRILNCRNPRASDAHADEPQVGCTAGVVAPDDQMCWIVVAGDSEREMLSCISSVTDVKGAERRAPVMGDAAARYGLYGSSAVGSGGAASEWWREANAAISGPKNSSAPLDTDSWILMGSFRAFVPSLSRRQREALNVQQDSSPAG
jgi:hypothetical protein